MGQITLRLSDEQERYLKSLAKNKGKKFAQYIRELLDLGLQIEMAATKHENVVCDKSTNKITLEILYLVRYMIKRIFKDEGAQASKVAAEKANQNNHGK